MKELIEKLFKATYDEEDEVDIIDFELETEKRSLDYIKALVDFADEDYEEGNNGEEIWLGEDMKNDLIKLCEKYHLNIRYPEWGDGCIIEKSVNYLSKFYIKDTIEFINDILNCDYFEIINGFEELIKARDIIQNYIKGE